MIRLVAYVFAILAVAAGLHWLADRPGTLVVEWQGYVAETSVFRAFIVLMVAMAIAMLVWSVLRWLWSSPAALLPASSSTCSTPSMRSHSWRTRGKSAEFFT